MSDQTLTIAEGSPRTKALRTLIATDSRVTGFSIEPDGVFIYTDSTHWCDDAGSGTFRGDSETAAVRAFRERVQPAVGSAQVEALNVQFRRAGESDWTTLRNKRTGAAVVYGSREAAQAAAAAVRGFKVADISTRIVPADTAPDCRFVVLAPNGDGTESVAGVFEGRTAADTEWTRGEADREARILGGRVVREALAAAALALMALAADPAAAMSIPPESLTGPAVAQADAISTAVILDGMGGGALALAALALAAVLGWVLGQFTADGSPSAIRAREAARRERIREKARTARAAARARRRRPSIFAR